jgi:ubiquinol-cytochrome c reductase cytochrome b subunit
MSRIRWNKDHILAFVDSHIIDYPTPINLNYMWSFGSTAVFSYSNYYRYFLAMHYTPHVV